MQTKDERLARMTRYRGKNRDRIRKWEREFYWKNKDEIATYQKSLRLIIKEHALSAYGGAKCGKCGREDINALTLDHIDQDGSRRREEGHPSGVGLYRYLRDRGYPPGFRVLCFNCNIKSWLEHARKTYSKNPLTIKSRQCVFDLKIKTLEAYGGCVCELCGNEDAEVLGIDHLNGGGNKHRKDMGFHGGQDFYRYLRDNKYPPGYRVLCLSCNNSEDRSCD